jgi:AraC-like DNA-binding protein
MTFFSNTSWISTLDMLAAAQGIFLAVLLVGRGVNQVANRYLSLLMVVFSVDLLSAAYFLEGLDATWPHLIGIDVSIGVLYGPLLYLYARALTESRRSYNLRDFKHFIPFVFVSAILLPFYLQTGDAKLLYRAAPGASEWFSIMSAIGYGKLIYSLVYILLVFGLLRRHRRRIREEYSTLGKVNLAWLTRMMYGGLLVWGIAAAAQVLWTWNSPGDGPVEGFGEYISVASALFVYPIGYLGLRQAEIFRGAARRPEEFVTIHDGSLMVIDEKTEPESPDLSQPESYSQSGLTDDRRDRIHAQLTSVMEDEKPFRDSGLTLQQLSDVAGLMPHHVSEALNQSAGQNFYEFVNRYRVEEAKALLSDVEYLNYTVLAIGMDAGFNSKSTFNAAFKKITGQTPSAFKKAHLAEMEL